MGFIYETANILTKKGYVTALLEAPPGPNMYYVFIEDNITGYYENGRIDLVKNPLDISVGHNRVQVSGNVGEVYDIYVKSSRGVKDENFMNILKIIQDTYNSYLMATIHLKHIGGYIAKFYVNWKEGDVEHHWKDNGRSRTAPYSSEINLPEGAMDLTIKATEKTGLVWEPWRTVLDRSVSITSDIYVSIWGTTLNPKGNIKDHE